MGFLTMLKGFYIKNLPFFGTFWGTKYNKMNNIYSARGRKKFLVFCQENSCGVEFLKHGVL